MREVVKGAVYTSLLCVKASNAQGGHHKHSAKSSSPHAFRLVIPPWDSDQSSSVLAQCSFAEHMRSLKFGIKCTSLKRSVVRSEPNAPIGLKFEYYNDTAILNCANIPCHICEPRQEIRQQASPLPVPLLLNHLYKILSLDRLPSIPYLLLVSKIYPYSLPPLQNY